MKTLKFCCLSVVFFFTASFNSVAAIQEPNFSAEYLRKKVGFSLFSRDKSKSELKAAELLGYTQAMDISGGLAGYDASIFDKENFAFAEFGTLAPKYTKADKQIKLLLNTVYSMIMADHDKANPYRILDELLKGFVDEHMKSDPCFLHLVNERMVNLIDNLLTEKILSISKSIDDFEETEALLNSLDNYGVISKHYLKDTSGRICSFVTELLLYSIACFNKLLINDLHRLSSPMLYLGNVKLDSYCKLFHCNAEFKEAVELVRSVINTEKDGLSKYMKEYYTSLLRMTEYRCNDKMDIKLAEEYSMYLYIVFNYLIGYSIYIDKSQQAIELSIGNKIKTFFEITHKCA